MDEGRVGFVRRQEDQHRKAVCILNDIAKNRLAVYNSCLLRDKHETSYKHFKSSINVRRAIVKQKVLKKCLDMRKVAEADNSKAAIFGKYGGVPLQSLSRDMDLYIASMHPKVRRMRKVQRLLEEGAETGALLNSAAVNRKMDALFDAPEIQKVNLVRNERLEAEAVEPTGNPTDARKTQTTQKGSNSVSKGGKSRSRDEDIVGARRIRKDTNDSDYEKWTEEMDASLASEGKTKKKKAKKEKKVKHETDNKEKKRRPTLILPPLSPTKSLVESVGSKTNSDW